MEMLRWCLVILLVMVATRPATAAPQYIIHDLGLFDGTSARLTAINNRNVAVGYANIGGGGRSAVIVQGSAWQPLGRGTAAGINDGGIVVGSSPTIGGMGQAWFWDGVRHEYPGYGAVGINEEGHIAGRGAVAGGGSLWFAGVHHPLGSLGTGSSEPFALNNLDQVVGRFVFDIPGMHAFLSQNGVMQDLGVLTGRFESQAVGINDQGVVIGWSRNPHGEDFAQVGFYYDGQMHDLPFVPTGINNKGQIVGGNGIYEGGQFYELPGLNGQPFAGPLAINENGWIVGSAFPAVSGPSHAVIWEPVPEPGSLAALGSLLAGFGLAALARLRA
jgi:probable HAF family extracellular repeat protein